MNILITLKYLKAHISYIPQNKFDVIKADTYSNSNIFHIDPQTTFITRENWLLTSIRNIGGIFSLLLSSSLAF